MVSLLSGKFLGDSELSAIMAPVVASGIKYALIGGAALASHGCPRMISNVDVAAAGPAELDHVPGRALPYGGAAYFCDKLKVIRRTDEYVRLYFDAVDTAKIGAFGYRAASIEHLGAMKLAMRGEGHHRLDLEWILLRKKTDFRKLRALVYAHVGGRFGVDVLEDIKALAEMEAELDRDRNGSSYP